MRSPDYGECRWGFQPYPRGIEALPKSANDLQVSRHAVVMACLPGYEVQEFATRGYCRYRLYVAGRLRPDCQQGELKHLPVGHDGSFAKVFSSIGNLYSGNSAFERGVLRHIPIFETSSKNTDQRLEGS